MYIIGMDKFMDFISWAALEAICLIAPPSSKDIKEFNKQQPETKLSTPAFVLYLAAIAAVLILPIGFLILAFSV